MTKWMSEKTPNCDFCGEVPKPYFVDGATGQGPWAIMCPQCFRMYGRGLGLGRGQKYDAKTLEKVEK